jgi:hypothetical protein
MQDRFMKNSADDRAHCRAMRIAGAMLLTVSMAGGVHAGPLDEAMNSFSKKLSEGTNKGDTAPDGKRSGPHAFAENMKKWDKSAPQADPQDYSTHQVPVGTRVRIGHTHLERVMPQPTLSATPVDACISIARGGVGPDGGMVIVKGYTNSQENPAAMRKVSGVKGKLSNEPPFQAFWAQVQHVPVKPQQTWEREFDAGACRGWVRIDRADSYQVGTGPYRTSLLSTWQDFAVTEASSTGAPGGRLAPGQRAVVKQMGWMMREPRPGSNFCQMFPGDELTIVQGVSGKDMYKVRLGKMRVCRGIDFGYVQENLIR